jgi:diguanylate cyclase (GGDEF)-like protein
MDNQGGNSERPRPSRASHFDINVEEEVTSITSPGLNTQDRRVITAQMVRDRATLTLVTGPQAGAIYTLTAAETTIGRGKDCTIRVDDPGLSRTHARVVRRPESGYLLEDLGSSNGTTVLGERIKSRPLSHGDSIALGATVGFRFSITDAVEEGLLRRLYESSILDGLTGTFNRKHFGDRLAGEIAFAKRHRTKLSLLIVDFDHFKRINDTFGHPAGDEVLRSAVGVIKRALRTEDILARYGGEEFAIIARGIDVKKGMQFAERIRTTVAAARIVFEDKTIPVTVSVGVASLNCCPEGAGIDELVALADERLYAAKQGGRNRCVGAPG